MSRQRAWFWVFAIAEVSLVLLLGAMALAWNNGISMLERYQAGDRTVTMEQLDGVDSFVQLLGILTIVGLIVRLVTLVGWLHSCVRLIADEHLGALTHTPGWAIGAWFVPFLNLVRVPRIFMDVQAAGETKSRVLKEPSTIVLWWLAFIALAILDRLLAAPTNGEGIDYVRRLSTEATQSTMTQFVEAVITVPLLLGLTTALGHRLATARSERARLAAFPAPAVALDPSAYAAYGSGTPYGAPPANPYAAHDPYASPGTYPAPAAPPAPYGPPQPVAGGAPPPGAAPAPYPPYANAPQSSGWAPPTTPGESAPLPGFAPHAAAPAPPQFPPPSGAVYHPAPSEPAPASGTEAPERVRILSDHEKADLAASAPPSTDAGWYDDPLQAGGRRWWNGAQWTGRAVPPAGG